MPALQTVIDRKQNFGEWVLPRLEVLFLPYRDPNYSLEAILHFFMKRLGQSYSEVMLMDRDRRDEIFDIEYALMRKENEANSTQ